MPFEFTYWDNSVVPPKKLYTVVSEDILDADKQFQWWCKKDPAKTPTIGCQIKKVYDTDSTGSLSQTA